MIVGVLKEVAPETRVSLIAEGAAQLIKKNIQVWIEAGAGSSAFAQMMITVPLVRKSKHPKKLPGLQTSFFPFMLHQLQ